MNILLLLLSLILPLLILIIYHKQKRQQKSLHPPGPPGLPFIGNLHQFDTSAPHIYLWRLSKKYGPLMSMKLGSVPVLVVSSPKMAKEVLKTHDLVFSSRPRVLGQDKLSYNRSDIAFAPYSESWRELRKICVLHLLSNKQVQSFRPIREKEVFRMIRSLSVRSSSGQATNLSATMLSLTSTLICRVAFGKMFDEEGLDKRRFDELMIESQAMQGGFFFSDYLPSFGWVDRLSGMIGRLDKICKELDEFYQELIDEHLDPSWPKSVNLLDLFIQLKAENSCSIDLTWDHVKAILMINKCCYTKTCLRGKLFYSSPSELDIFIAGTDTGAATIIWTMTALMKHPTSMKKLQNEIRELIGEKAQETLRLYPPAPLLLPRETLEKCNLNGYTIPPKTLVYVNAWAIARDPEYWENPNEFQPERFLNTNVDIIGQDFQVIPFGAGEGCPGISMGLATVEIALANLVYSFDWDLPSGMKKEDIDTEVLPGLTMHKKIPLSLVPRNYKYP
ncbi:hypothetical protein DH2020_014813 [Rehmannia glutinosa]|uniref:Uncharacterized protein n=1 Tax=Rehmannia glutinosa TaxID=99300 RepID=A0ABR0WZ13_REHGL